MREDGALGNAGRAARVLQEGDVGVVDLMGGEAVAAAISSASLKPTAFGSEYSGTIFFTLRTTKLTSVRLKNGKRSPTAVVMMCSHFVPGRAFWSVLAKFSMMMIAFASESRSVPLTSREV